MKKNIDKKIKQENVEKGLVNIIFNHFCDDLGNVNPHFDGIIDVSESWGNVVIKLKNGQKIIYSVRVE